MASDGFTQSNCFPIVAAVALAAWSLLATYLIALLPTASKIVRGLVTILWISACMLIPIFLVLLASDRVPTPIAIVAIFVWLVPYSLLSNRVWRRARHAT